MRAKAEPPSAAGPEPAGTPRRKPSLAFLTATVLGVGYLPFAPGTWGSLGGIVLAVAPWWVVAAGTGVLSAESGYNAFHVAGWLIDSFFAVQTAIAVLLAAMGVWSASCVAAYERKKDPQHVVIDEVSGQHLALLVGSGLPVWGRSVRPWIRFPVGLASIHAVVNWKYLVLGFILFRVFDVWKPFPARQAEFLRGGWGIMTDDWIAGIYAGLGLWLARAAGL
jgi:phosphatidylglycerophosphatase A